MASKASSKNASEEKVVSINVEAAKARIKDKSSQAIQSTQAKLKTAAEGLKERVSEGREKALAGLVERGISLTRKQLKALENLKKSRD